MVLSNCDPQRTFNFVGEEALNKFATPDFRDRLRTYDYSSATFKINVAVNAAPNFSCIPNKGNQVGPQHHGMTYRIAYIKIQLISRLQGTVHFLENTEQLDDAFTDALKGIPSKRPFIEMTIPSSLDDSLAPPGMCLRNSRNLTRRTKGQHVVQLFVQYAPYKLAQGSWDDPGRREKFAQSCYDGERAFPGAFVLTMTNSH